MSGNSLEPLPRLKSTLFLNWKHTTDGELLLHGGTSERLDGRRVKPVYDRLGSVDWEHDALPGANLEIFHSGFLERRQVRRNVDALRSRTASPRS